MFGTLNQALFGCYFKIIGSPAIMMMQPPKNCRPVAAGVETGSTFLENPPVAFEALAAPILLRSAAGWHRLVQIRPVGLRRYG